MYWIPIEFHSSIFRKPIKKKKKNLEKGGKNLNWETKNFIFLLTYEN